MKGKSIWEENKKRDVGKELNQDLNVDVLIIGGGLTGFSVLYELCPTDLKVCLVERNTFGSGVTSKSTAKINYLQGIVYSKIKKEVKEESAKKYLKSQLEGIEIIKERIKKHQIDCDLEKVSSFLIGREKDQKLIEEEYQFLKNENLNIQKEKNTLKVEDTYTFHPLKYLDGLINVCKENKSHIYENTCITKMSFEKGRYVCETQNNNRIKAKQVVLACHYPFELLPFFFPVRTYIEKSYIMALKRENKKLETSITTYPDIVSKRYYKDYEILLKGSYNICSKLNEKENFENLIKDKDPEFLWKNEDIMTADHLPFIGYIKENLFLATGYNTWGMATSQIAGKIIKDFILKKENEYQKIFNPYRKINIAKIKQYPLNILSNIRSFTENKIKKEKSWYPKEITFSIKDGKSIAKQVDKEKEYFVYTTCPHLGCTLIFNEIENTWDCPCHASRFDKSGHAIKGPSVYDIKVIKD